MDKGRNIYRKRNNIKTNVRKKERVPENRRKRNLTNQERRTGMEIHKQRKKKREQITRSLIPKNGKITSKNYLKAEMNDRI